MTDSNNSERWQRQHLSRRAALRAAILGATIPGALYLAKAANSADAADDNIYIPGAPNFLELGHGWPGKELNAGKITYRQWSDALDIVGAGTIPGYRKVKIWDDLYVQGLLNLRAYIVDPEVPRPWTAFLYAKDVNGQSKPFWKDATGTAQPLVARSATLVVAANDASPRSKLGADYVCDHTADDVEINAAIAALPAGGGKVMLTEGTFNIAATIDFDVNSVTLEGQGMLSTKLIAGAGIGSVIKVHKATNRARVFSLGVECGDQAGVNGIYYEATADPGDDAPWNSRLQDIDIRNVAASCYAIKVDALYLSVFDNIYCHNVANGLLWAGITAGWAGHSRLDSFYVLMNKNNGVGIELNRCEAMSGSRWDVFRAGSETGWTGIKLYTVHNAHISQICIENASIGIQVDGANGGMEACTDCTFDTGYIHSADNAGKGIYATANALRSNFLHLDIEGTTGGTSKGIDDDVVTAYQGSRYRDCYVKIFDTLVSRVTGNTSTFSNVAGYLTENGGKVTLSRGTTSIAVNHGLDVTPAAGDIIVTPIKAWGAMTQFYVANYTSTQFTIYADQDPGQDVDFAWKAVVS